MLQECPKTPKKSPRTPQDSPKRPQRAAKRPSWGRQGAPTEPTGQPRRRPRGAQGTPGYPRWLHFGVILESLGRPWGGLAPFSGDPSKPVSAWNGKRGFFWILQKHQSRRNIIENQDFARVRKDIQIKNASNCNKMQEDTMRTLPERVPRTPLGAPTRRQERTKRLPRTLLDTSRPRK